jgi:acetyl/propionyl-CoA carboxylase alpha subunit
LEVSIDGEIFHSEEFVDELQNIKVDSIRNHEEFNIIYHNFSFEVHLHQRHEEKKKSQTSNLLGDYYQDGKILAPMPGKIVSVKCKTGDKVNKGQELVVFEAMKMENYFTSPFDGRIKSINIKANDTVAAKQVLIEIEERNDLNE